jgi:hypothetical protein
MHLLLPIFFELNKPVWSGPITPENGRLILQSPVRNELERRILEGESAVWVLLEGASAEENTKALGNLRKALKAAESELRLPHEFDEEDTEYDTEMSGAVKLKLAFSTISLKSSDPLEGILVGTIKLMVADAALDEKPVAVPVFGRGRALGTYIGEGIEEANIFDACAFLTGPCSCQVKALNPGVDLFMPIDWDGLVEGTIGVNEALPPLSVPVPAVMEKQMRDTPLKRNLVIAALIGLFVLAVGTVAVMRRAKREK